MSAHARTPSSSSPDPKRSPTTPTRHDEAIKAVPAALGGIRGVRSIILFGSTARGTAREDSDIDLFIDCDRASEDAVRQALHDMETRCDVDFSPAFYREAERDTFDTQFLESILRHGRALVGGMPRLTPQDLDLQPLRLVSYRSEKLRPRERARLLREIDGYRTRKRVGRKRYTGQRQGFLKENGGWRAGRGAVVIPEEAVPAFDELLRRYRVTRSMVPIWSQRP
jgi:predicted nucleotidyltransferase